MPKRIKVTEESSSGRNNQFYDNFKNISMTRSQFVKEIDSGNYSNYHVRKITNMRTPVSNPDSTRNNNLD